MFYFIVWKRVNSRSINHSFYFKINISKEKKKTKTWDERTNWKKKTKLLIANFIQQIKGLDLAQCSFTHRLCLWSSVERFPASAPVGGTDAWDRVDWSEAARDATTGTTGWITDDGIDRTTAPTGWEVHANCRSGCCTVLRSNNNPWKHRRKIPWAKLKTVYFFLKRKEQEEEFVRAK